MSKQINKKKINYIFQCEYCQSSFTLKKNLDQHQKNAKYCKALRTENSDSLSTFKCEICSKEFTSNQSLNSHLIKCMIKEKADKEIQRLNDYNNQLKTQNEELKAQVKDLQDKLENVAVKAVSRSTTTNNTTKNNIINTYIQNMKPITEESIKKDIECLTEEHILNGAQGYAKYALDYPLKDKILCIDFARRKIKYKDETGNVIIDPEMVILSKRFFQAIEEKNHVLFCSILSKLAENCSENVEKIGKLMETKDDVENMVKGQKTDFHYDFIKEICNKTIKQ